jgi:hypothetical protein
MRRALAKLFSSHAHQCMTLHGTRARTLRGQRTNCFSAELPRQGTLFLSGPHSQVEAGAPRTYLRGKELAR